MIACSTAGAASATHPRAASRELPRRLLPERPGSPRESLEEYRRGGGYDKRAWSRDAAELIDLVDDSGLLGRGGAAFPAGRKWRAVAKRARPTVVLVNAAESEPASRKDRTLLQLRPHLVIEGALLAMRALRARECVFYLHDGPRGAVDPVTPAMRELRRAGWKLPRWRVVTAPRSYVAGEETAAVQRSNGKPAKPTAKPPLPCASGVGGRPTLVQNAETLANVPLIAREGAQWFRRIGSAENPGTMLVTLSGAIARPGVYEVPGGTPIGWLLGHAGGIIGGSLQALLPGGYFSGWLDAASVHDGAYLAPNSLRRHGAALGAASISVVPDSVCGLSQAVALLRFFAEQSARQCGPCTNGTVEMVRIAARIARGRPQREDLTRLRHYAYTMLPERGACGHLDGAATAARTMLTVFGDEMERHMRAGTCGRSPHVALPGLREA